MSEPTEQSAAALKYKRALAELAKENCYRFPDSIPAKIAKHYCSLAMTSLTLLQLVNHRERVRFQTTLETDNIDYAINSLVKTIKDSHLSDFGIPLEWTKGA